MRLSSSAYDRTFRIHLISGCEGKNSTAVKTNKAFDVRRGGGEGLVIKKLADNNKKALKHNGYKLQLWCTAFDEGRLYALYNGLNCTVLKYKYIHGERRRDEQQQLLQA